MTAKLFEDLKKSIEDCEPEKAKEIAQELVKTDVNPLQVIDEVLYPTMEEIGSKFENLDIFGRDISISF